MIIVAVVIVALAVGAVVGAHSINHGWDMALNLASEVLGAGLLATVGAIYFRKENDQKLAALLGVLQQLRESNKLDSRETQAAVVCAATLIARTSLTKKRVTGSSSSKCRICKEESATEQTHDGKVRCKTCKIPGGAWQ